MATLSKTQFRNHHKRHKIVGCTAPWVQPTCNRHAHLMGLSFMCLNFSSSCKKVSMSYWDGWLRRVGHAEEKKRKEMGWCIKAIRPMGELKEKKIGWSKVKVGELHLLWIDVKSVKGRKEEKEGKSQSVRTVQFWRTVWVRANQKRGEKYRDQEKIVRDKKSEWKVFFFFFLKLYF